MKRVLVVGATGFIGRYLTHRLLESGLMVRTFGRSRFESSTSSLNLEVVEGDLRNEFAMKSVTAGVDTIFHLAAKVHELGGQDEDQEAYDSINIQGTYNLLKGAVAAGAKRFIFFSTVKAIGEGGTSCLDESAETKPVTAYGRSKLAAERLVLSFCERNGFHGVCLRLPLVYGPGNKKGNLFRMIAAIDRGIFPPFPPLENHRSLVHVSNVVAAALIAAAHPVANGQSYIVTDGRAYSTRRLYELICRGLGKRIPAWHVPLLALKIAAGIGDATSYLRGKRFPFDSVAAEKLIGSAWYSSEKISRELGYSPTITFENALPELIAWYRQVRE